MINCANDKDYQAMEFNDLTATELINELSLAGEIPHPALIQAIWDNRAETEPLLLALFDDSLQDNWDDESDPRWFRFVHAGKFMLAWENENSLPTFARMYASDRSEILGLCTWFEEDIFRFGPSAIPYLKPIISQNSNNKWHYGKGLSSSILTQVAIHYPETRAEIIAIFQEQLPSLESIPTVTDPDEMLAVWATELGLLADESSRDLILALDAADLLYEDYFYREYYLRDMARGFKPQNPLPPYDICTDYQAQYDFAEHRRKWLAREERIARFERPYKPSAAPKVGRNDPCPCGSGKKYKKCHGRLGAD
jgi:hypothetical protein